MSTITLTLSRSDAQLIRLSLLYLIAEREKAPEQATQHLLPPERASFIAGATEDLADLTRIRCDIDAELGHRHESSLRAAVIGASVMCELHAGLAVIAELGGGGDSRHHRQMASAQSATAFRLVQQHNAASAGHAR